MNSKLRLSLLSNKSKRYLRFFLVFLLSIITTNCNLLNRPSNATNFDEIAPTQKMISIDNLPLDDAMIHFKDDTSQQILSGISSVASNSILNIYTIMRCGPEDSDMTSYPYRVLKPGQTLEGYILLVNKLQYSHILGLMVTVDYRQVELSFNGSPQIMPRMNIDPSTKLAVKFSLPPLPDGLHTIIFSWLKEPDHYFTFNPSRTDQSEIEAMNFRTQTVERAVLVWVTPNSPRQASDWPAEARNILPKDVALITDATLVKEKPKQNAPDIIFINKDTLNEGTIAHYFLRLTTSTPTHKQIPMILLINWDESKMQTMKITVPEKTETSSIEDFIPLEIQMPSTIKQGNHTLTVTIYPYPNYLHFWNIGDGWYPDIGYFSYPAARFPVTVN